jgi:hypothetical protein
MAADSRALASSSSGAPTTTVAATCDWLPSGFHSTGTEKKTWGASNASTSVPSPPAFSSACTSSLSSEAGSPSARAYSAPSGVASARTTEPWSTSGTRPLAAARRPVKRSSMGGSTMRMPLPLGRGTTWGCTAVATSGLAASFSASACTSGRRVSRARATSEMAAAA